MQVKLVNEHQHCPMSIRWKLFRNKTSPTPGLFCSCHDVFLDWLPDDIAYELIDNEKVPVEIYTERKKKKKSKPSGQNKLKARQKKQIKFKQVAKEYKDTTGRNLPK